MIADMTDQPTPSNNPNLVDSLLHPQALIIRQLLTRPGRIELNKILIDDEENILQALDAGVEVETVYYAGDEIVSDTLKKETGSQSKGLRSRQTDDQKTLRERQAHAHLCDC